VDSAESKRVNRQVKAPGPFEWRR